MVVLSSLSRDIVTQRARSNVDMEVENTAVEITLVSLVAVYMCVYIYPVFRGNSFIGNTGRKREKKQAEREREREDRTLTRLDFYLLTMQL